MPESAGRGSTPVRNLGFAPRKRGSKPRRLLLPQFLLLRKAFEILKTEADGVTPCRSQYH